MFVISHRAVETSLEQFFSFRSGSFEAKNPERTNLRHETKEESQQSDFKSGLLIFTSPVFFVARTRDVVQEFLFCDAWNIFLDLIFIVFPGDLRGSRVRLACPVAIISTARDN